MKEQVAVLEGKPVYIGDTLYSMEGTALIVERSHNSDYAMNMRVNDKRMWLTNTHWENKQVLFWSREKALMHGRLRLRADGSSKSQPMKRIKGMHEKIADIVARLSRSEEGDGYDMGTAAMAQALVLMADKTKHREEHILRAIRVLQEMLHGRGWVIEDSISLVLNPTSEIHLHEHVKYDTDGTLMFGFEEEDGSITWVREDEMSKGQLGVLKGMTITSMEYGNEDS